MIQKIKKILHLPMKHRCCICGEKFEKADLNKYELSVKENSVLRLLKGIDDGYFRALSNRVNVCDNCQTKFEGLRKRINNALEEKSPIALHYDSLPLGGGKRIRSGWSKSIEVCEEELKTLARFYEVKEVDCIEREMSEVEEFPDHRVSTNGLPKEMQKLITPTEYIYRLNGYIPSQSSISNS